MEHLLINNKPLKPHKAYQNPLLDTKNVLTESPWEFVSLWLRKEKQKKALFYWDQAHAFSNASKHLPVQSSPLLHYYSFMNMAKAMLISKNITFDEYHGVKSHNLRCQQSKISLSNEGVKILNHGILPALSVYLNETATQNIYSLEELLYNIPCVHRTFCLSYKSYKDLFIPLKYCHYCIDSSTNQVYLCAQVSPEFNDNKLKGILPPSFEIFNADGYVKSKEVVHISNSSKLTNNDIYLIANLNSKLRIDLQYIDGANTLWYLKGIRNKPKRISRYPLTIMLAIMHRLSELCRYKPLELSSFLEGQKNWLLSEFINMTPRQFLDEIATEMTGYQFLRPNVRQAS